MESMRLLQRTALAQLLEARPAALRRAFHQVERASSQPLRTRTVPHGIQARRSYHSNPQQFSRPTLSTSSSPFRTPTRRTPHTTIGRPSSNTHHYNRRNGGRRWNSTSSTPEEKLTLSQRLKKLSREYGWSALGVYLLLTAADFPFCFLAVRLLGTDRIGHWEHVVIETVKSWVKWPLPATAQTQLNSAGDLIEEALRIDGDKASTEQHTTSPRLLEEGQEQHDDADEVEDHGYKAAQAANSGANASIWTQLALAYAIHKSFIFIRVPLTVSITPKVVKTLRGWGWNIGKVPSRKGIQGSSSSPGSSSGATGVNTKGSKVKPDD
ncbi:hypothetical protein PV10_08049 [Exophiala mesophila]|uniref:DUF1279 domain-containing protein n=1 Tax=Exophiala mesophila TaxID=212818 RepID=A0A0D1ZNI8_EXOME|nr:uncharacterized protein PV10_08049 [Exophiala mesophila]KIV88358.1 hypothetical protein PV10_08049 [Exophiala mesophila]